MAMESRPLTKPLHRATRRIIGASGVTCLSCLEHDPEKWIPVFGKIMRQLQKGRARWLFEEKSSRSGGAAPDQFAAADSVGRALADALSSRNVTFTAMSGRMRGSLRWKPMRTRTVAFSRLAVGTTAMTVAG